MFIHILYACVILIVSFSVMSTISKLFVQYTLLNKYKNCVEIFNHFVNEAYQIVYKDQIVSYSVNGVTPQKDELETAKRNFIKLSFELMGSENSNMLQRFYGSRQTLITNMITYFQTKIDDDEILKMISSKPEEKET